jgi:hypothetical protein
MGDYASIARAAASSGSTSADGFAVLVCCECQGHRVGPVQVNVRGPRHCLLLW